MTHETFFTFGYIGDIWLWVKKWPITLFDLKVSQNLFQSKINLNLIADIIFDLRNEFHANRMSFGVLGTKSFLRQFWPILTPLVLKIENFSQNWSSRAGKLATCLFLYGESEKIGPICRPFRIQVGRILLTLSLKQQYLNSSSIGKPLFLYPPLVFKLFFF